MLLDRVPGQPSNALVDPRGQAARELVCAWPPLVPTPSTARRLRPAATARRGRLPGPNVFRGKQREGHNGHVLSSGIDTGSHRRRGRDHGDTLVPTTTGLSCSVKGGRFLASRTKDAGSKSWRRRRRRTARSTFSCPDRSFDTRVRSFSSIASSCRAVPRWASLAPSMPLAPIEDLMVGRPARRVSDRVTVG